MRWLLVFGFGGLGALARVFIASLLPARALPWGTLGVNLLGCLAIGIVFALFEDRLSHLDTSWRLAMAGGLLGGFTTFSTFGYETFYHLRSGVPMLAAISVGLHLLAAVLGVWLGFAASSLTR